MAEWWGENWQVATGWAIGVLGILAAILTYWWQRKPKRLDYVIDNNIPVVASRTGSLRDSLDVLYEGRVIDDPYIATIRIVNTGKRAIRLEDYESPVVITYGNEDSEALDAFVSEVSSEHVKVRADVEDRHRVEVRPGLLNPQEWFGVQVISDGSPGEITVVSRFADQTSQMRNFRKVKGFSFALIATYFLLVGVLFIATLILGHVVVAGIFVLLVLSFPLISALVTIRRLRKPYL